MDVRSQQALQLLIGLLFVAFVIPGMALLRRRRSSLAMFLGLGHAPVELAAETLRQATEERQEALPPVPPVHQPPTSDFDADDAGDIACRSEGWRTRPGEMFDRFVYQGLLEGEAEQTLEISCGMTSAAGDAAAPRFTFWFSPGLAVSAATLFAMVSLRGSPRAAGPMPLTAEPRDDGSLCLRLETGPQAWALLSLLRTGGDMILQIHADPAAPIVRLPFPVGDGFEACYRSLLTS